MPHPLLIFSQPDYLIHIHILNGKQCRFRSVGFFRSQLIWIYTVCKGRAYLDSAGQGLTIWMLQTALDKKSNQINIFFLFAHPNSFFGYSLEAPKRAFDEYSQHSFSQKNMKNIKSFLEQKSSDLELCVKLTNPHSPTA